LVRSTIRVLVPQPFARALPRFAHAAREQLATPVNSTSRPELEWYFRERQREASGRSPADDIRFRAAMGWCRAPRFRALHQVWLEQGDGIIFTTTSHALWDKIERREGRFEFVPLTRQPPPLLLVGVRKRERGGSTRDDLEKSVVPPTRSAREN
jgi:hypothetical protein